MPFFPECPPFSPSTGIAPAKFRKRMMTRRANSVGLMRSPTNYLWIRIARKKHQDYLPSTLNGISLWEIVKTMRDKIPK
jgi:hypothetical protein